MEYILIVILVLFILNAVSDTKSTPTSSGATVNISTDPNAGIINFVDDGDELIRMNIFSHKERKACGCVNFYYKDSICQTDMCESCSDKFSPF